MIVSIEELYLEKALDNKKKYEQCSWWKFKERKCYYNEWKYAMKLMVKYSKKQ